MVDGGVTAVVDLDGVADALGLGHRSLVSLVGGGGKTTLLFALGRGLHAGTLLTTTTRMERERTEGFPVAVDPSIAELSGVLKDRRVVLAWRSIDGDKAIGFHPTVVDEWFHAGIADHVVVEADGARRRPFTAPAAWEPPIPEASTHVVACIGVAALGCVIAERLHRPALVAAAAGCSSHECLTPARAATALVSPVGMMKNVPAAARFIVAVVGADPADPRVVELVGELGGVGVSVMLVMPRCAVQNPF